MGEFDDIIKATELKDFFSININPCKREIISFSGGSVTFRLTEKDGTIREIIVLEKINGIPNPQFDEILYDDMYEPILHLATENEFDLILNRESEKHNIMNMDQASRESIADEVDALIKNHIELMGYKDQFLLSNAKNFILWLKNCKNHEKRNTKMEIFTNLQEACISDESYQKIIDFLIEKGKINTETLVFSKGSNKSTWAAFLKTDLFQKGYLKRKITNMEEVKSILCNTFSLNVGDTVAKTEYTETNWKLPVSE